MACFIITTKNYTTNTMNTDIDVKAVNGYVVNVDGELFYYTKCNKRPYSHFRKMLKIYFEVYSTNGSVYWEEKFNYLIIPIEVVKNRLLAGARGIFHWAYADVLFFPKRDRDFVERLNDKFVNSLFDGPTDAIEAENVTSRTKLPKVIKSGPVYYYFDKDLFSYWND